MSLGQRIMTLRKKRKQSLQDVADAVSVSKAHIWELEKEKTDNPAMRLVERLADHFGVSITYMVGEDVTDLETDPDSDTKLQKMFRDVSKLSDNERAILNDMVQSFLSHRPSQG